MEQTIKFTAPVFYRRYLQQNYIMEKGFESINRCSYNVYNDAKRRRSSLMNIGIEATGVFFPKDVETAVDLSQKQVFLRMLL